MNLYLISQRVNNDYDTYDSAVVCASDEADAKTIHPGNREDGTPEGSNSRDADYGTWTCQSNVKVEFIGIAQKDMKRGVVLASFNAG